MNNKILSFIFALFIGLFLLNVAEAGAPPFHPPFLSWEKTFGGAQSDHAYSVQQTSDGDYIIAGSTGPFGAANDDVYLIKTDGAGNKVWSQTFGGADRDYGRSVQQTSDGGYIIAGATFSFGAGGADVYLIKTDEDGNKVWSQTFGGAQSDDAYSVQQTSDGGYVIAGATSSFGAGGEGDVYLISSCFGKGVSALI